VLCVDEKSQIQALDRTQPGLPLKKGRAATTTNDYKRHGVTTLYAAMDVKSGFVIGPHRKERSHGTQTHPRPLHAGRHLACRQTHLRTASLPEHWNR
jgi:hypothetical protein